MEGLARRFVLSSLLVFGLFCVESEGMQRSKSSSDILSQHQVALITHKRASSDPVTMREKVRAIEICNVEDFQKLTLDEAKKLKSVTFRGMEINEEFVDKFWELFGEGIDYLKFDRCSLAQGETFHDLLYGEYMVKHLEINDSPLTDDDAIETFRSVYPWLLKSVTFSGMKLNVEKVNSVIRDSCALLPDGILNFGI